MQKLSEGTAIASIVFFLLWAGLFYLMMRFGCGAHVMGHGHQHGDPPPDGANTPSDTTGRWRMPEKDVDPVCRKIVEAAKAKTAVYAGHVYHFCSQDCRGKFEESPTNYLTPTDDLPLAKENHHAC